MSRFKRILLLATFISNVPFVFGMAYLLGETAIAYVVSLLLGAALALGVRGRIALAFDDRPITTARRWLIEKPYWVHWCACIGSLPTAVVAAPLLAVEGMSAGTWGLVSYGVPFVTALYAVLVRPHMLRVRELEIAIADLPEAFDGYRVAQLSDLHIGALTPPERAKKWIDRANGLDADLFALTGDYVTSGTRFHEAAAQTFAALSAKDGTMAVLGNHDNFGGCEPLLGSMRRLGIVVLQNEHRVITRSGARLTVVGVDDVYSRRADVDKAFQGVPRDVPIFGLAHDPKLFGAMASRGAKVVLSGHTHWGQIGVPFLHRFINVARPFFRYPGGRFRSEEGATLWVHPGMGTTGPPVRLGVAPEITVIVLRSVTPSGPRATPAV
jgi:uncharacterized protein